MNNTQTVDQIVERELELLFRGKMRANPSRYFWPLITGKLGEQVSRRPREWIMDSVGVPVFGPVSKNFYRVSAVAIMAVIAIVFAVMINTSDGEQTVPVASSPDLVPEFSPESSIGNQLTQGPQTTIATVTIVTSLEYGGNEGLASQLLITLDVEDNSRQVLSSVRDFVALIGQNREVEAELKVEEVRLFLEAQERLIGTLIRAMSSNSNSELIGQAQVIQAEIQATRESTEELFAKIIEDPIASARIFERIERGTEDLIEKIDSLNTNLFMTAQPDGESEFFGASKHAAAFRTEAQGGLSATRDFIALGTQIRRVEAVTEAQTASDHFGMLATNLAELEAAMPEKQRVQLAVQLKSLSMVAAELPEVTQTLIDTIFSDPIASARTFSLLESSVEMAAGTAREIERVLLVLGVEAGK